MITVLRGREDLPKLPEKGEEFPVRPSEATVGTILVEEVRLSYRPDGKEIVQIMGFG
ncbi:hypothetical protein ACSSV8_003861 [Roseovarius sp. MBR-79]|jgi:hypothetical protein|uniref:hypothetical protein n=1 Tax=Roseovarius sp. MBR-78 TaxID=3156460 RepID=UPI0033983DE7